MSYANYLCTHNIYVKDKDETEQYLRELGILNDTLHLNVDDENYFDLRHPIKFENQFDTDTQDALFNGDMSYDTPLITRSFLETCAESGYAVYFDDDNLDLYIYEVNQDGTCAETIVGLDEAAEIVFNAISTTREE